MLPVARVCANLQCLSKHKDEALPQAFLHRVIHTRCAYPMVSMTENTLELGGISTLIYRYISKTIKDKTITFISIYIV